MKNYILYGLTNATLENDLKRMEIAFGVVFHPHESSYRGEYYRSGPTGQEHVLIQPNYLDHEDEWIEEEYQQFPMLLYINETDRVEEWDRLVQVAVPTAVRLKCIHV